MNTFITSFTIVALLFTLYFVNLKPIMANNALIDALIATQTGNHSQAIESFKKAYLGSIIGRQEAADQIVIYSPYILSSSLPIEERNKFYAFAKGVVMNQAEKNANDARATLSTGLFLYNTGAFDEAFKYLEQARTLSPKKQQIYIEIAKAYFAKGDNGNAIKTLKLVEEISPELSLQISEYIKQIQSAK